MGIIFGTNPKLLHRKDSPQTSIAAAYGVDTTKLESEVFMFIESCGKKGATAYECIKHFKPVSDSTIHARPSALERKGLIFYRGDTRKGGSGKQQRIMRSIKFYKKI